MKLFFRVFLLIQLVTLPLRAQYMVQGVVTDSLTKEPLPYTSVYLKGTTEGGMTDNNGRFSFKTYRPKATLVISAVGYNEYVRLIHPAKSSKFNIALSPATYALDEVVVKPKRERYKKKDNPAVEFVRKMIEHRDDYSPDERDFWKRDRYEKMTFAINNFDSLKQQKWLYRKFKFLTDYVDTSAVTGRPVLAISNRELLATDYYRKSPHSRKQWVTARRQAGVDEMLSQQGMEQAISVTMTDVDLYENNITLFTNKFVSPLSSLGPSFYKYYLMDTLTVAGKPCVDLTFVPFNSESFGFTGHLYVMLDSTYFVKRAVMNFPQKINLNFVDYMKIEQNFDRAEDGTRQLLNESITTEFKLVDNSDGIYAKRDVYYRNYQYEPDDKALQAFRKPEKVILTAVCIGLRPEHFLMAGVFLVLFFAGQTTRKLAVALLPFFIFGISYDWMRVYPNYQVNPIDVKGLYEAEKSLFGLSVDGAVLIPCEYFALNHCPVADFFAGIFYLCWVPVPIAFGLWLYLKGDRKVYLRFAMVFLLVNLIGFAGYYIHPAAPPWYAMNYGFEPILDTPGNVAGLGRFDELLGCSIFNSIYGRNANVFAAVPSLHAAYMVVALAYAVMDRSKKWLIALFAVIMVGIWWTAVYSGHHYLIDVMLGISCALLGIFVFEKGLMKWGAFGRFFERYSRYIK